MAFNLRHFLEEKIADVNPFDGGKTGATVRAQRHRPAPAQTVSRGAIPVSQAQSRNVSVQQAPQRTISVARPMQPQAAVRVISPRMPKPAVPQKDWGKLARDSLWDENPVVDGAVETVRALARTPEQMFRSVAGLPFKERDQDLLTSNRVAGIPGTEELAKAVYGGPIKTYQQQAKEAGDFMRNSDNKVLKTLAPAAPLISPVLAGLDATGLSGVSAGTTAASKVGAPVAKQAAKQTATTAKNINRAAEQFNPRVKEIDEFEMPRLKQAFDVETDPVRRVQINRGIQQLNQERLMLTQGGYIAGPNAKGFKDAQAKGLVFEGVDGKPRFEVDDSGARFGQYKSNMGRGSTIGELLDHPEMFDNYPDLRGVKVWKKPKADNPYKAEYTDQLDSINIREDQFNPDGTLTNDGKETLLHELQHAIQKRENFASGGSLKGGRDEYMKLAGEAEARAVQARMNMKPEERTGKPFYDSLDVPKEDLIIRNGDGPAMSLSPEDIQRIGIERAKAAQAKMAKVGDEVAPKTPEQAQIEAELRQKQLDDLGIKKTDASELADAPLVRQDGRFIASTQDLPENASGSLKRKVQIANKQADRKITESVRDMTTELSETANVPANRVREEAVKALEGSETVRQVEADRIAAINEALIAAGTKKINVKQAKGKAQEFIAIESNDAGGIQLKPIDESHFMREDGVVVDKQGKSVGTYVRVEGQDIIAYVGGKPLNITGITGDPNAWGKSNLVTRSFTRLLELNAPDEKTFQKTYDFTVRKKMEKEAVMKTELLAIRKDLKAREEALSSAIPNGISKKELSKDIMRYGERKTSLEEIAEKYGNDYAKEIADFDKWARNVYDTLLERANKELVKYGKDPIPRRNNYYTHFQKPSVWAKVGLNIEELGIMGKGVGNEVNPSGVRKGLPTEIAGTTEEFKPITKFNPFAQKRRGSYTEQDAFASIDAYLDPIMFNIHMTEPAARVRVMEKAFRAADKLRTETLDALNKELEEVKGTGVEKIVQDKIDAVNAVKPKDTGYGERSQFVTAIQEYANSLTGKTNAFDRVIMDKGGAAGGAAIDLARQAQGIAGASSIPGNLSSALAQTLSFPQTIAMNGPKNTIKGIAQTMKSIGHNSLDDPIRKSPFMRTRYTDAESLRKGAVRKYTDVASIPLQTIERAFGEINWYSNYATLKAKGFTGDELIRRTDMMTEKTLAGRGIGDRPEVFRSTAANTVLQFGLEVNNSRIQFFKEMTPKQKAYFLAAASAMNYMLNQTTGNSYLPDYIDAAIDEFNKWNDSDVAEEDRKSPVEKAVGTGQRMAGETAKFVPGLGVVAPFLLGDKATEAVFGKDSNVTRFGDPAMTKLPTAVATAAGGAGKLLDGETENNQRGITEIRKGVVSVLPTGSQINKTLDGVETLLNGEYKDRNGKSIVDVDETRPDNIVKGLAFGKYAINEIRDKFQGIDDGKNSKTDNKKSDKQETEAGKILDAKQERTKKLRESMSEEDRELMRLSKADRQKLIDSGKYSEAKIRGLENYYATKRKELGYGDSSSISSTKTKTYKDKYAEAQKEWDKNSKNWSEPKRMAKQKDLQYLSVKKDFDDDIVDTYYLSKEQAYNYVATNQNGQKIAEQVLRYGDALVNAGLISKNKYRDKDGNESFVPKGMDPAAPKLSGSAKSAASKHGIPSNIFAALIQQESGGNQAARSPVGAIGLTQLMPETAKGLGVDPYNAEQNLEGGARYLSQMYKKFGSWELALAAYNAGPGAVEKYGGIPPFPETQNYVKSVLAAAKNGDGILSKLTSDGSFKTGSTTKRSSGSRSSGSRSGSRSRSTGSRKKAAPKFDYKLYGFGTSPTSNSKQLYDLLKKAKMKAAAA